LSTISQNNIVVNYVITSDQIAKTKTEFDKLTDAEKKAYEETKKLNDQLKKTGQEGGKSVKGVGSEMSNLSGIVKSGAGLLAGFFSVSALLNFKDRLVETTIKFEGYSKAIQFGSGSLENYNKNQQFLNNLIQKYGLGLAQTTEAYKSFFNASTLAGQSQQETNRQFEAVTKAGTVLKLTTDQMQGAFLALGQMMSKGTIQAEELRGQLGERIPGAFSIMAKALGVNERQLNKMLEQGQVLSKDALPKFAAELEKTFGPQAEKNLNGLVNSQNRFNTAMEKMILTIGTGLGPSINTAYESAASFIKGLNSFLISETDKVQEQINKNQAKNLETYVKGLEKVSNAGIKNVIENAKREKIVLIEEDKKKEQLFQILLEKRRLVNESTKGTFFSRRALGKEIDEEIKLLKEGNVKRATTIADYNAQISAANDELAKREKQKVEKTIGLTDAELKALKLAFDARMQMLNLEKQERELRGKLANDPNAGLTAQMKFLEGELALKKEYQGKGLAIKDIEIIITKEKLELAKKDYEAALMDNYGATVENEEAKEKARKASMDQTVKDNKEMIDAVNKEADDLAKKEFDRIKAIEQARQEANQQAFDLAVFSTNAIFDIQSQYAANDFARKQKQFDEEIRLADGNIQKETEINEKRAAAEKEYRLKEFRANQLQAVANAVFTAAPYIIKYSAGLPVTAANLSLTLFALAAQTTAIMAQPPPEFAEGTKGKKYKGRAIVGERGTEKVVTQSGRVYYTPPVATLAQFDEPVEIIPNHQLGLNDRKQLSLIYGNRSTTSDSGGKIIEKLSNIEIGLKNMPVAAISLDERGFMKKVRTPNRSTTILNNRFKN
jgi:tape measure domain-containing protein